MGIAFPAAVAGGGHAHQPGVEPVLDIALQYAVVDQHVALRRRALVIDGQRSAPSLDGAVVDHRHARCGHALADQPGERSEEHTSELQSLMRISYAVFCLKKKNNSHL